MRAHDTGKPTKVATASEKRGGDVLITLSKAYQVQ